MKNKLNMEVYDRVMSAMEKNNDGMGKCRLQGSQFKVSWSEKVLFIAKT